MSLKIYTDIKSINLRVERALAQDTELSRSFYVRGELSNVSYSGRNMFFTLKDNTGEIPCAMWGYGTNKDYKNGQAVMVCGSIGVWTNKGAYKLIVSRISLEGDGKLAAEFERLKSKLEAEGLFDQIHKKPVPKVPKAIGLVTSRDGEAINDVINKSYSNNTHIRFVVYPSKVQGIGAAESIVKGIQTLDTMNLDAIIVGRGGGSLEERWAFNEEIVARAIFAAKTPIISAVGHEQNFHLSDFVADVMAKTPTDAGDLISKEYKNVIRELDDIKQNLYKQLTNKVNNIRLQTESLYARLEGLSPKRKLENQYKQLELYRNCIDNAINTKYSRYKNYLDNAETRLRAASPDKLLEKRSQEIKILSDNLNRGIMDKYDKRYQEYKLLVSNLHALSPSAKLTGGFGYITHGDKSVDSVHSVSRGDMLTVKISDGLIDAVVDKVTEEIISQDGGQ